MTFQPASENHAIVEAVFGLLYARPFTPKEIEATVAVHNRDWPELPKLNRQQIVQFQLGELAAEQASLPAPVGGVSFDRVEPDGTLGWRLRVEDASLIVNCLKYRGWNEVWGKAWTYLQRANDAFQTKNNPLKGAFLQYIDVFEWHGEPAKYSVGELLDPESPNVPLSIQQAGIGWHLHQGRFIELKEPTVGRLLERVHLDGGVPRDRKPFVKFDTFLSLDFAQPIPSGPKLEEKKERLEALFDHLHAMDKGLLRAYLRREMAEKIGL